MKKVIVFISLIFILYNNTLMADNQKMILELKDGKLEIELFQEVAPKHVERIINLASNKEYDGVVFHRVIEGFMAQTGDVQFGNTNKETFNLDRAGTGSSNLPDLKAEFNDIPHERGTLSMARSSNPDSGNSQFFICFQSTPHLDRNYTVFGKVVKGMEFVDKIKKGDGPNGLVENPDKIIKFSPVK